MRERRARRPGAGPAAALMLLTGCAVGFGEGSVSGEVTDPECGLDADPYTLRPTFFSAGAVPDEALVSYRIQRGGHFALTSDGLRIDINDPAVILARLGEPIPIDTPASSPDVPGPAMNVTLYLNETCSFRDATGDLATVFPAVEGALVFDSVYAPGVEGSDPRTEGRFTDLRFADPRRPDARFAVLSGSFAFSFERGRPAQPFP
ncbi:MAG: hypothetical protein AAF447_03425 [Myxococcota bacterium]